MYKTPLQQLIVKIDWMIENSDPVHCAGLELAKSLAMSLLPVERDAIVDAVEKGRYMKHETGLYVTGEQYYRTKYGETYH
jgi:hypothetical protein